MTLIARAWRSGKVPVFCGPTRAQGHPLRKEMEGVGWRPGVPDGPRGVKWEVKRPEIRGLQG
jgi:hypothetical protein